MFAFICLVAGLAAAAADGYYYPAPLLASLTDSLSDPVQQQYHMQDSLGQYSYGYSEPLSSKQETRTADGVTRGSYSYLDASGQLQTVTYTADAGGFRVAATNLPNQSAVTDTPEVLAARAQHLEAHKQAKLRLDEIENSEQSLPATRKTAEIPDVLPRPVEDTAEVAAAKAEFFKRYEATKRNHQLLKSKQVPTYALLKAQPVALAAAPLALPHFYANLLPTSGFQYNYKLAVPALKRAYLPATIA